MRKRTTMLIAAFVAILATFATGTVAAEAVEPAPHHQVGIWYELDYYGEVGSLWGSQYGTTSDKQLLADVNGDGKADLVTYEGWNGAWWVDISNGHGFELPQLWVSGHGVGSTQQFLGDVNGDGKADAIVYFASSGNWYVALSNGHGFEPYTKWAEGNGAGASNEFVGDVNGDGKADAVSYYGSSGTWYVGQSTGTAFSSQSSWISGHGVGSSNQMLGDVNGDGKMDAVVYFGSSGSWYVATSAGTKFNGYNLWISGDGIGSDYQMLGDVNGDGKADAVVGFVVSSTLSGNWYSAWSTGASFEYKGLWKEHLGDQNTTWEGLADASGDHKADPVAFWKPTGIVRVNPTEVENRIAGGGHGQSRWDEYGLMYQPIINGVEQAGSNDSEALHTQMQQIASAGINYILLDDTNTLFDSENQSSEISICKAVKAVDQEGAHLKYAVAIGHIQFESHSVIRQEEEAGEVWNGLVNNSECGGPETYFDLGGKPLIVNYTGNFPYRTSQEEKHEKPTFEKFTTRWGQGAVPDAPVSPKPPASTPNGGCGTPSEGGTTPPPLEQGEYVGWAMPYGSVVSENTMVVMPGWNNHAGGGFIAREQGGSPGGFYVKCGWERVLGASPAPNMVVINSYNEYAEDTAVAPTVTAALTGTDEKWPSPNYYWELTTQNVMTYKQRFAPVSLTAPALSAEPKESVPVSTGNGLWEGFPTAYTYKWNTCTSPTGGCTVISGATSASYTPTAGEVHRYLRAEVKAKNPAGATTAVTAEREVKP